MHKILFFFLGIALIGCSTQKEPVKQASATINPTQNSTVNGLVTFEQTDQGVQIVAIIDGLTPGKHGIHIHEHGDCSAPDASDAGAHYNPTKKKHGAPHEAERHVGDLGNLIADENGHAHYQLMDTVISLNGDYSIIGKSVLIHEKEDDFVTQPAGNAGARQGCGKIVAQK